MSAFSDRCATEDEADRLALVCRDRPCACPPDAGHPSECLDCPVHSEDAWAECADEQAAEIWAENAWLRAAEAGPPGGYDPREL